MSRNNRRGNNKGKGNRSVSQSQLAPRTVDEAWEADENPLLEAVGVEFGLNEDLDGMPQIRDLRRMLPSKRMRVMSSMVKLKDFVPDANSKDIDPGEIVPLLETAESILLDLAIDRAAMERWLVYADSPETRLMAAFMHIAEQLGK